MKKGVRIVNCARGGVVNEKDLREATVTFWLGMQLLNLIIVDKTKQQ